MSKPKNDIPQEVIDTLRTMGWGVYKGERYAVSHFYLPARRFPRPGVDSNQVFITRSRTGWWLHRKTKTDQSPFPRAENLQAFDTPLAAAMYFELNGYGE